MNYALLVDYNYCTGCHACEIACNQEYQRPLGQSGIRVFELTTTHGSRCSIEFLPTRTDLCNFCAGRIGKGKKPACVHHCLSACLEVVDRRELPDRLRGIQGKQMIFL